MAHLFCGYHTSIKLFQHCTKIISFSWDDIVNTLRPMTHICVGKLTDIGSDNGLSPGRHPAIIWTNAGISLIGPLGTNIGEFLITIHTFSFNKMHLKMSSAKWRPFCLVLICLNQTDVMGAGSFPLNMYIVVYCSLLTDVCFYVNKHHLIIIPWIFHLMYWE